MKPLPRKPEQTAGQTPYYWKRLPKMKESNTMNSIMSSAGKIIRNKSLVSMRLIIRPKDFQNVNHFGSSVIDSLVFLC